MRRPWWRTNRPIFRKPLLALGLGALAVLAALTIAAVRSPYLAFDVPVERFIQSINFGPLVRVFWTLDWLEGQRQLLAAGVVIVVITAVRWKNFPLAVVAAASGPIYSVIQSVIQRPRPSADLVTVLRHTGSSSFPSGHIVFFSWVCVLLVVCIAMGRLPKPAVIAAWVVAGAVLLIACLGRIYLGEHWPSDVIAGLALGLGWTALVLSVRRLSAPALERSK
jgi:undecaprenyl-diphosphatase